VSADLIVSDRLAFAVAVIVVTSPRGHLAAR
jgi:hypothetical protein